MTSLEMLLRVFNLLINQDTFNLYRHLKSHRHEMESFSLEKYRWEQRWLAWWSEWSFVMLNCLVWKSVFITLLIIYVDYFRMEATLLGQLRAMVPDPFNEARVFMSIITLGVPLALYVSLVWLRPIQAYPMYMHSIRTILEPELEVKRLDAATMDIVERQIGSAERARWNLLDELCCLNCNSNPGQGRKTQERRNSGWFSLGFSLGRLEELKKVEHYSQFRPILYTAEWHKICRRKAKNFLTIFVPYTYTDVFVVIGGVVCKVTCARCKGSDHGCNILNAYSPSELIYLLEVIFLALYYCTTFIYLTLQLYLALINLHTLVKGLRNDLERCLEKFRYFNSRLYATPGEKVHLVLEEMTIRVGLFDIDIKSVSESLNSLLTVILVIVATLVGAFLLGYKLDQTVTLASSLHLDLPSLVIYLSSLIICNIIGTIVAYTNGCITRTLELYWSIDAELMHFEDRKQVRRTNVGHLAFHWHKLGSYLADTEANQYLLSPFGLELTYADIVEYNFYIISALTFVYK